MKQLFYKSCKITREKLSLLAHERKLKKQYYRWIESFTLIELIVVLSVIMILATLLIQALNIVKDRNNDILCLKNMVQVTKLESLYLSENNCYMQKSNYNTIPNRPSNTGDLFWQDTLMPYYDPGVYLEKLCYKKKEYISYDGRNYRRPYDVFDCPSIEMRTLDYLCDNFSNNFSYSSHNKVGVGFNSNCLSSSTDRLSLSRISNPSSVFMLMDMLGDTATDHGGAASRLSTGHPSTQMWRTEYGLNPRHRSGESLNAAYFDGHVKTVNYFDLPQDWWEENEYGCWTYK